MTLRIAGGRVYDPANGVAGEERDVCLSDGKVVEEVPAHATRIDARGMVVMPGGVDIHAHIAGPKVNAARRLAPEERLLVAPVLGRLLQREHKLELRLQAALALGEFADVGGVVAGLGTLALASDEPIDLRYSAFTSVQRAGPTPECVALFRSLSQDETFGPAALDVLALWGQA